MCINIKAQPILLSGEQFSIWWLPTTHLSKWACSYWYYWYPKVYFSTTILRSSSQSVDCYEISIAQMTMDILPLTKMCSILHHCQDFYWNWLYIWIKRRVSYKKQELIILSQHLSSPPYICWGSCCSLILLSYNVSLRSEFRGLWYGSSLPPVI